MFQVEVVTTKVAVVELHGVFGGIPGGEAPWADLGFWNLSMWWRVVDGLEVPVVFGECFAVSNEVGDEVRVLRNILHDNPALPNVENVEVAKCVGEWGVNTINQASFEIVGDERDPVESPVLGEDFLGVFGFDVDFLAVCWWGATEFVETIDSVFLDAGCLDVAIAVFTDSVVVFGENALVEDACMCVDVVDHTLTLKSCEEDVNLRVDGLLGGDCVVVTWFGEGACNHTTFAKVGEGNDDEVDTLLVVENRTVDWGEPFGRGVFLSKFSVEGVDRKVRFELLLKLTQTVQ
jgi:hypothetical protein